MNAKLVRIHRQKTNECPTGMELTHEGWTRVFQTTYDAEVGYRVGISVGDSMVVLDLDNAKQLLNGLNELVKEGTKTTFLTVV